MKKIILIPKITLSLLAGITIAAAQVDGNYTFQLESTDDLSHVTNPKAGIMVFNTADNKIYFHDGSQWINVDKPIISSDANNSLKAGSDGGAYLSTVRVLTKTLDYTLTANDNRAVLRFDTTNDVTLTIPAGLPIGFNVSIYQVNSGKVTITGASGVSVKNRLMRFKTAGKDAGAGIVSTSADVYHITGDLRR